MHDSTRLAVETFWADLFTLDRSRLWREVTTTHPHGLLGDYDGWYVAWREKGVHISAPPSATTDEVAALTEVDVRELQRPEFWHAFAGPRGARVIGPSQHHYLDDDPGVPGDVEQVSPSRLTPLRGSVTPDEWDESGIPDALDDGGEALAVWGATGEAERPWVPALLGGAVLTDTAGANRDIGLLVAADSRGRGVGLRLGQAAASYAVRWHGWARWTCRVANEPSLRTAARLGFEPYATQLAVRA